MPFDAAGLLETLRAQGITDERVLGAIADTPRELFVEEGFEPEAFRDTALPIACGQTISQPYVVAYMSQLLALHEGMRVLEIGTGSGYQTAVLSRLAGQVYTVERHLPLLEKARARFAQLHLDNIHTRHGDGYQGWAEEAPFDRILATAAFREFPETLVPQLVPGGILVAPVGQETFTQRVLKITRTPEGVVSEALLPVVFVPMVEGLPDAEP